jgi:hypothetical protein
LIEKAETTDESSLQEAKDGLMRALDALSEWAGDVSRGITAPYIQKTVEGWDRSFLAISKQRDQESKAARRQRRHLEHWLWPHQQLQERVLSPLTLFQDRAPELLGPVLSTMDIHSGEPISVRPQPIAIQPRRVVDALEEISQRVLRVAQHIGMHDDEMLTRSPRLHVYS